MLAKARWPWAGLSRPAGAGGEGSLNDPYCSSDEQEPSKRKTPQRTENRREEQNRILCGLPISRGVKFPGPHG